jgi:hypothetical protein
MGLLEMAPIRFHKSISFTHDHLPSRLKILDHTCLGGYSNHSTLATNVHLGSSWFRQAAVLNHVSVVPELMENQLRYPQVHL